MQTTLKSSVTFSGTGLHTGAEVHMSVHPASAEYGIWFRRTDIEHCDAFIPARWDAVTDTQLCTRISNADGVSVSTVEHVLAALAGCGIHNALIEVDGPEAPLLDGSAAHFVTAFLARGLMTLDAPVYAIEVLKVVKISADGAFASLEPAKNLTIDFSIEFADAAIGRQEKSLNMANGAFVHELCDSRTFCRKSDIDAMRDQGLIVGGDLRSAVVVDGDMIVTPGGMRYSDEPVRHKMLDALGDLSLAGAPILGHYKGTRAGHSITNRLLRELFADPSAYRIVECDREVAAELPGAGLQHSDRPELAA
ncbi:MAG: UDP-3-O-acyl-N-acetylglucosamine deacetylase [Boseongicola sp.]